MAVQWSTMGKGKRYRRRGYKIVAKKRYTTRKRPIMDIPSGIITRTSGKQFGFPSEVVTSLRYVQTVKLTSTSNSLAKNTFRFNSLFDPDVTGTGHQPMYADQFGDLYQTYVVLGARATVTYVAETVNAGPMFVGICANGSSSLAATTADEAAEQNNSSHAIITGYNGGGRTKLSDTYSPSRDLGLTPDDDTTGAAFGANPSQQWYFHISFAELSATTPSVVQCQVVIEYYVKFRKLAFQTQN